MSILKLPDEQYAYVYCVFRIVDSRIKKYKGKIGWTEQTLTKAKKDSLKHHALFIRKFSITQTKVDPYKILSWYGFFCHIILMIQIN